MVIDPEVQRVLDLIRDSGRPPFHTLTPAEAREVSNASRAVMQPDPPPVALVEALTCPGPAGTIPLRHYRGAGTAPDAVLPALVFYHGGGWVIGDLDSHDQLCRALANLAGCTVVAVDYRLAPEHRFPAAVEDCAAATHWVFDQAAALRIDPARIAVGGDSAGGNLAAVMALLARDGQLPTPCFQLLLYPVTDLRMVHPSYQRVTEGFVLVTRTMQWFRDHYLARPEDTLDWRASPLRAVTLAGVAPALVMTVAHDPLCDEGIAYAKRLDDEGVRVTHIHLADQMHAFLTMGRFIGASAMLLEMSAAALRDCWRRLETRT